jgi:hypothetical protein
MLYTSSQFTSSGLSTGPRPRPPLKFDRSTHTVSPEVNAERIKSSGLHVHLYYMLRWDGRGGMGEEGEEEKEGEEEIGRRGNREKT